MKNALSQAATIAVILAAAYAYGQCTYRAAVRMAQQRAVEDSTDARVARLAAREIERESTYARDTARLQSALRAARRKVVPIDTLIVRDTILSPLAIEQLAARDTVIRVQDSVIVRLRTNILELRGGVTQRDSIIQVLVSQRNTRRAQAERRFHCGLGPGTTLGLNGRVAYGATVACVWRF